jgi:TonB family protein
MREGQTIRACVFLLVLGSAMSVLDAAQTAVATFVPARRVSGSLPAPPPPNVVGWIDERFEVVVDAMGRIGQLTSLRVTPMPADPIAPVVAEWRFRPAVEGGRAVPSRVLVAAMFRPPHAYDAPTLGTPPADLAAPSDEIPFPVASTPPRYPPMAVGDAVVLVEVLVGLDGRVHEARIISGVPGFNQASLDAAQGWRFRPARRNARVVESYSYLIFAFRVVTGGLIAPKEGDP